MSGGWPVLRNLRARRRRRRAAVRRRADACSASDRFIGLEPLEPRLLLSTFTAFTTMPGGNSASWADYNNDGYPEVNAITLWDNNSGASFTQHSTQGGMGTWGDFNNDGWVDYYSSSQNLLWRNNGATGSFTGIAMPALPSNTRFGGTWLDIENDGDLDLYVGGALYWQTNTPQPDVILRNNGDETFSVIWTESSVRYSRGVTHLDFDEDGDQDVYVTTYWLAPNYLWRNDGSGNFTDVASAYGATGGNGHGIGSAVGDIDNDGHLDIFAANFSHFGQPQSRFLRNTGPAGNYTFQDMGQGGVGWQESYASAALGDMDNDGDLDLFFTTVYSGNYARLYRNDGNFSFTDVTSAAGLSGIQGPGTSPYDAAWADFDKDGDLDLMTGNGTLYRNNGNANNWLKVNIGGDPSQNINAMGAEVRLLLPDRTLTRQVEGNTGQGNQNDLTLHFGLGSYSGSIDMEVRWAGGLTRNFTFQPNQTVEVSPITNQVTLTLQDIGEVGQINDLTDASRVISLQQTYLDPVVFAQSASYNGTEPVVVDVYNVQSDRFTIQLSEPPNQNGTHGAEQVTYVVLEEGNWHLPNGAFLEVGTINTVATVGSFVDSTWAQVPLTMPFDTAPMVMTDVQTANGFGYVTTRTSARSASSFKVALEQEEAATEPHGAVETIGYFAMDTGVGDWSGMAYQATVTDRSASEIWHSEYFSVAFSAAPSLLSYLTGYKGPDSAHLRYDNLTVGRVQFKAEEDTSHDTETAHTPERVSFLAIEGTGLLAANAAPVPVGETGVIPDLSDVPQTILFDRTYDQPVVFAQSASYNGQQPASIRITDVQSDRFTVYVQEPPDGNGIHGAETVTYLVLEEGIWELDDGRLLEVGAVDTSATVGKNVSSAWESTSFDSVFASKPLIMSQVQTNNDTTYVYTRQQNGTKTGVDLALEQAEAVTTAHGSETIGYMAIETGAGVWSGHAFVADYTSNAVTQAWYDIDFGDAFTSDTTEAQGFIETFDGSGYTPEQSLPSPPWTTVDPYGSVEVSSFGWMNTQASYKPGNTPWGSSTRPTNLVGNSPIEMTAKFHVEAADIGDGTTRLTWTIQSVPEDPGGGRVAFEYSADTAPGVLWWVLRDPDGVAISGNWQPNTDTWYESRTTIVPNGTDNWLVTIEHRQWTGSAWGTWQADLTDYAWNEPAFAPSYGRLDHLGTLPNSVVDDFAITSGEPGLLTNLTSYDGIDSAHVRYQSVSASGAQVMAEEDTTYDTETNHTSEVVGYFAIGSQGVLLAKDLGSPMGEAGQVNDLTHEPQTIVLSRSYTNPVVIAQSASTNGTQPVIVRITDVQSDRFTMYLQEPPDENGLHTAEQVTYFVIETGRWQLADGTLIEAGTVTTGATVGRNITDSWEVVSLSSAFTDKPLVMTQTQTANDTSFVSTRQRNNSATGFEVAMEEEEASLAAHGSETIGYIAMQTGVGNWGGTLFEAGYTGKAVDDSGYTHNFAAGFTAAPLFLSNLTSYHGLDSTHVRHDALGAASVNIKLEEDTTLDSELAHTTENVGYLALAGAATLFGASIL